MDLVNEYFDKKGFDREALKQIILKQNKLAAKQNRKKYTLKSKSSVMVLSPKALNKIKRKISRSIVAMAQSTHSPSTGREDTWSNLSKKYNSGIMGSLANRSVGSMSQAYYIRPTNCIEKYDVFERKVRRNFHESYKQNFPDSSHVLEEVLNLMFQTADNSFTKSLSVVTKDIRVVPDTTAKYMNAKQSLWDRIQNLVQKDLETVRRYNAMPKSVFGKTFQNNFKIDTSKNDFKMKWHKLTQHVAHYEELETFSAVWKNITHLQTTRKFCLWLANNPQVKPPIFLETEGLLKDDLSFDYSIENDALCKEFEIPDAIIAKPPRRFSKVSSESSSASKDSFFSDDISDVNIIV